MEYSLENIVDKKVWEDFVSAQRPHSFLQSWNWGETNQETGSKIFRIGIRGDEKLLGVALMIKIPARRGSFLLVPHGPIFAKGDSERALTRTLLARAAAIATVEGCAFLRVCPLAPNDVRIRGIYRSMGFRRAPIHMHPELAWMLDITKPEEQLLKEMRKTTRYLIKKTANEGVEIVQSADPKDIELFWPVYAATAQRQSFTPFSKRDLQKEFELCVQDDGALFFFGKQGGKIVAAAIIIFYNGQAFYHHSGSLSSGDGSNVSYLLQWRVIQEAKKRGCTLYNFWGISPDNQPQHPWTGLSRFKKGFGGFAEEYMHAQDKPLTWKYTINYVVETTRRIKRGF